MDTFVHFLTTCLVAMVTGFPYGPPPTNYTCKEMFPVGHEVDAQLSNPPFEILLSQNLYTDWEYINVTINALKGGSFRGFLLQARRANCRHKDRQTGVGVFESKTNTIKPMDCVGGSKNALSHSEGSPKKSITVMWNAPGTGIGHIYFVATVVQFKKVFWTNVFSDILREVDNGGAASICPTRQLLDPYGERTTTAKPSPEKQGSGAESQRHVTTTLTILMVLARTLATII